MKTTVNLLFLSLCIAVLASSCSKSDDSPNNEPSKEETLPVICTATITYADENNRKEDFNGTRASHFNPDEEPDLTGYFTDMIDNYGDRLWNLNIIFRDKLRNTEINITIGNKPGNQAGLAAGVYDDPYNEDYYTTYWFKNKKDKPVSFGLYWGIETDKYNDQYIIYNAALTITEISDTYVRGSFYFDAYVMTSADGTMNKVEVKNGKFEGTTRPL